MDRPPATRLGALSPWLAAAAFAWAGLALLLPLPPWPIASLGVVAMVLAAFPGPALHRGLGAFLGLIAFGLGSIQIAALFGITAALK